VELIVKRDAVKKLISYISDAIFMALLFLAVVKLPKIVTDNSHDSGSQAAIEYWTMHGFSYGRDIIQNVGPLGFINYLSIYTGFLDGPKLLINVFLTGSFVFLLWKGAKSLPVAIRLVFIVLAALYAVDDVMIYLLLLLVSYQLMHATRLRGVLLAVFILALLALAKGTCFFIALFIIAASVASSIVSRRFVIAGSIATGFAAFLLALWTLTGQSIANLATFAYAMASFSSGYNEAMTIFEPERVRALGFIVLLGSLVPIFAKMISCIRKIRTDTTEMARQFLQTAIEFFILFVVWKHGFVRADIHVLFFFEYALISHLWILFRKESLVGVNGSAHKLPMRLSIPLGVVVTVSSLLGIFSVLHSGPAETFWGKYVKMDHNRMRIADIPGYQRRMDEQLTKSVAEVQVPYARALAGNDSIGYFGIFPTVMLYNQLNYIPSPSQISFASWNPWIMGAEKKFFEADNRAPTYLLFDLYAIDNRLVAQDDSLAQLEILHRYELAGYENGNMVLHRIRGKEPLSMIPISERKYKVGEWVDVQDSLNPMWVKIVVKESPLARLVGLAYKPSQYFIEILFKNGVQKTYKFVPQMAATGFMINPLIVENSEALVVRSRQEYQRYVSNTHPNLSKAVKFRIGCDRQVALCGRRAKVTFEDIHGLAMGNDVDSGKLYKINSQIYGFDVELMDFKAEFPIARLSAFGNTFYQFHAPSRLTVRKPNGVQKLKAYYGLNSSAYEQGGATDGVELSVRLETDTGKDMLIFKRDLSPVETPGDRGEQALDVNLPSDAGTLYLYVNPKKNISYDHFIIRNLGMQNLNQ